jgi:hypothetical protein
MRKAPVAAAAAAVAFSASLGLRARAAAPAPELTDVSFSVVREARGMNIPTPDSASASLDVRTASVDGCQFIRDRLADPAVHEVVVPTGTYLCARPIVVGRSGVTLRGEGRPTLRLADHAESPLLLLGGIDDDANGVPTPVSGLMVEGLALDGNRVHQSGECWGGPCDTGGTTAVRNSGIDLRGVKDSVVRDVAITGARSGGLVTERDCAGIRISGLTATDSFYDGLSVNWTKNSVFENLRLTGNQYAGLTMDFLVNGNVFRDGDVSDNHDVGVYMRRADGNRFERLTVAGNASHGVYLSDVDRQPGTCAENNVFSVLQVTSNGRDGFHMDGPCTGDEIRESVVTDNKGAPVVGGWTAASPALAEVLP